MRQNHLLLHHTANLLKAIAHTMFSRVLYPQCNLQNMSETNLTTVNGEFVNDVVILRDGDEFCIGKRQFKYQSGGKVLAQLALSDFPH